MNIHLLRSPELDETLYRDTLHLLQGLVGYLSFIESEPEDLEISYEMRTFDDDQSFRKINDGIVFEQKDTDYDFPLDREEASWRQLFESCKAHRHVNNIPEEDAVVLLTDIYNNNNWFAANEEGRRNFFIHTADWDYYLGNSTDKRYPIAYHLASSLLRYWMFDDYSQVLHYSHKDPRGCIMDFCSDKREVILKMRTADVCGDCLDTLGERDIDHRIILDCFSIMDGVRSGMMFRSRSEKINRPSRLEIRGEMKKLFLKDLGNLEVRLNPKEKSVYMLFLDHPEGIHLQDLHKHYDKLKGYYSRFSNIEDPDRINGSLDRLLDLNTDNFHVVLSRIKRKFRKAVGDPMSRHYIISGLRGEPRAISLDRSLVSTTMRS